jgi:hypothetical protein
MGCSEGTRDGRENSLQKLGELAHARVTDEHVQLPERLDRGVDQRLPRLGRRHVARDLDQLTSLVVLFPDRGGFRQERGLVLQVGGQVEVVHGDVAALADELERDGTSDSRGAAGDGGGLGEEEVVRHDGRLVVGSDGGGDTDSLEARTHRKGQVLDVIAAVFMMIGSANNLGRGSITGSRILGI